MRQLILFRHAKAEPGQGLQDFDRALADRGRQDAPIMGEWLTQNDLVPQLALVSPARRTRETWERAAVATAAVRFERSLYEASAKQILSCIHTATPEATTIVMVGHNPGLEELAIRLSRIGDAAARRRLEDGFSPGSIAVIAIKADSWDQLSIDDGELIHFVTPKTVGASG